MGNPTGFESDEAMGVGEATVDVRLASLLRDPLVIERIYVSNPRLTYEINLSSSNFARIQENVKSKAPAGDATPGKGKPKKQKGVIIRDLLIEKGEGASDALDKVGGILGGKK